MTVNTCIFSIFIYCRAVLFTYFCNRKTRIVIKLCKYRLVLRIHPCNFFFNLILFRDNKVKP